LSILAVSVVRYSTDANSGMRLWELTAAIGILFILNVTPLAVKGID
jgi:hypothetical protein